ncbi:TspO/MBR family protein [Croceibacterium sp. TMG7-5b_MA50]|uniref:TspO/MBR family protein n=1 Tax=Croceibacterium sp. TMG7-5b_MA50 TaxID=3121290 RepID=UPI00322139B5
MTTRRNPSLARWLIFCVPGVLLLGTLSGLASGSSADDPWFQALVKPAINPPGATFGIVWPILYVMMGVALALVGASPDSALRRRALAAFAVQLLLNLAWSPTFFAGHRIGLALAILLALDVALIVTLVLFLRVRQAAGVLLLPYLAWVLFAAVLNWRFLQLNPAA